MFSYHNKASDATIKHDPIQIHELQINPGRYEVLANGRKVSFSCTEFRIPMVLAKSPGWVFSRYQTVNEVRGGDSIVTDRSVDVHIPGLGKKLALMENISRRCVWLATVSAVRACPISDCPFRFWKMNIGTGKIRVECIRATTVDFRYL